MNRTELIKAIAEHAKLDQKQAGAALTAFTEIVTETLQAKDSVALIGFGTFSIAERAARTGRNPKTGEEIQIAKTTKAKFKVGKALDDAIKGNKAETSKAKPVVEGKKTKNSSDKIKKAASTKAKKSK